MIQADLNFERMASLPQCSRPFGVLAKFQGCDCRCVAFVLECVVHAECHLRLPNTVQHTPACQNLNWHEFTVMILSSHRRRFLLKSGPTGMATSSSNFQARWTTVDKDLSKLEKYTLIPGLSINFFLGLTTPNWSEKLVQAMLALVSCFHCESFPTLIPLTAAISSVLFDWNLCRGPFL